MKSNGPQEGIKEWFWLRDRFVVIEQVPVESLAILRLRCRGRLRLRLGIFRIAVGCGSCLSSSHRSSRIGALMPNLNSLSVYRGKTTSSRWCVRTWRRNAGWF